MLQTDPRLPDGGAYYCGPVSLTNGLMWLSQRGFPNLVPRGNGDPQARMTRLLAGNSYLKTVQNKGTSTPRLMTGVLKYLNRQGYKGRVQYRGWRTIDRHFQRQIGLDSNDYRQAPRLKWMQDRLSKDKDTVVVLDVGWYLFDEERDVFHRRGGHWVTLVGYDTRRGQTDLIIHNPDPRAGLKRSHDRIKCRALTAGVLTGRFQGLPVSAKSFLRVNGVPMPNGVDTAIIDAAVAVRVERKGGKSAGTPATN